MRSYSEIGDSTIGQRRSLKKQMLSIYRFERALEKAEYSRAVMFGSDICGPAHRRGVTFVFLACAWLVPWYRELKKERASTDVFS